MKSSPFSMTAAVNHVVCERVKYVIEAELADCMTADARNAIEFEASLSPVRSSMIIAMKRHMLAVGAEVVRTPQIDYPEDWWQAFRQRWFPKWWLRRYPVREIHIPATEQSRYAAVCPHHDVNVPRKHVEWLSAQFPVPR